MGLFSKKIYICEKCGKEFEKRINLLGNVCDDCWINEENEKKELEKAVKGYKEYHNTVFFKSYTAEEMREIINHRDELLDKFQNDNEITKEELQYAGTNYKQLTEEEAVSVLVRTAKVSVTEQYGAGFTNEFFVLTDYENIIVDAKDVFAIGYTTDARSHVDSYEVVLCILFTNDPYVPVIPMAYVLKKGFFEFTKSKGGRAALKEIFESRCPNLTYTIGDIKELKRDLKQNGNVKGNLDIKFMLDQIGNATTGIGAFDSRKMQGRFLPETVNMLNRIGYIPESEVDMLLRMDKAANQKYWDRLTEKLLNESES